MGLELAKVWVNVRANDQGMHQDLDKTKQVLQNRAGKLGSLLGGSLSKGLMAGLGIAGIGAGIAILGAIAKKSVAAAIEAEAASVSIKAMVGNMEQAKRLMDSMRQTNVGGAFDNEEIKETNDRLIRLGTTIHSIPATLNMIGNVALGTGKSFGGISDIFLKVQEKGKLMKQELISLADAGVPIIGALSRQLGVADSAVIDMVQSGRIGFNDLQAAMNSLTTGGGVFAGLMGEQAATISGKWNQAKGSIATSMAEIGSLFIPLVDKAASATVAITGFFERMVKAIVGGFGLIGRGIGRLFGMRVKDSSKEVAVAKQLTAERARQNELVAELRRKEADPEAAVVKPPKVKEERPLFDARIGFAEFAQRIQDAFLKTNDDKQDKMIGLLALGNKKQDELITAVKDTSSRALVLQ